MMKHFPFIGLIWLCIASCTHEEIDSRPYPRIETSEVTDANSLGATFHAEVIYSNSRIIDHGFIWSKNENPTIENSDSVSLGPMPSNDKFSSIVKRGLLTGIKYYVRGYSRTDNYLVYGNIVSFLSSGSAAPNSLINIVPSQHLMPRGKVTVLGNFDGPLQVKINGQFVDPKIVSGITKGQFTLQLPDLINQTNSLSIVISGQEIQAKQKFTVALTRQAKPLPNETGYYRSVCAIGNKIYFGLGADSLFIFNPRSNIFSFVATQVVPMRKSGFSFAINGVGFFGGGTDNNGVALKDFYSIDTVTNLVMRIADLSDNSTIAMFNIKNKGYRLNKTASTPNKNELYEFDPITSSWTKKSELPILINSSSPLFFESDFFESDGSGYLVRLKNAGWDGHYYAGTVELWRYDPEVDTWAKMVDTNIRSDFKFGTVSANGKVYLVRTLTDDQTWSDAFLEFDPSIKTFRAPSFSSSMPFEVEGTFSSGGQGFIFSKSYIWKFDPTF